MYKLFVPGFKNMQVRFFSGIHYNGKWKNGNKVCHQRRNVLLMQINNKLLKPLQETVNNLFQITFPLGYYCGKANLFLPTFVYQKGGYNICKFVALIMSSMRGFFYTLGAFE
jgi:hypothetical protein